MVAGDDDHVVVSGHAIDPVELLERIVEIGDEEAAHTALLVSCARTKVKLRVARPLARRLFYVDRLRGA
jgi:hypothetical protein